jgi:hypothetical protein
LPTIRNTKKEVARTTWQFWLLFSCGFLVQWPAPIYRGSRERCIINDGWSQVNDFYLLFYTRIDRDWELERFSSHFWIQISGREWPLPIELGWWETFFKLVHRQVLGLLMATIFIADMSENASVLYDFFLSFTVILIDNDHSSS